MEYFQVLFFLPLLHTQHSTTNLGYYILEFSQALHLFMALRQFRIITKFLISAFIFVIQPHFRFSHFLDSRTEIHQFFFVGYLRNLRHQKVVLKLTDI